MFLLASNLHSVCSTLHGLVLFSASINDQNRLFFHMFTRLLSTNISIRMYRKVVFVHQDNSLAFIKLVFESHSVLSERLFSCFRIATGFDGVYNPAASILKEILSRNSISQASSGSSRRRRAISTTVAPSSNLTGISNPTVCLTFGEPLLFGVSNDYFPEYDEGNLYNTNPNFDYGAFKDLAEKHRLMKSNSTLFSFKFSVPGVYAFKLSSKQNSKMVSFCFI